MKTQKSLDRISSMVLGIEVELEKLPEDLQVQCLISLTEKFSSILAFIARERTIELK